MTVLHTVASLHPDAGGPTRTVGATCAHFRLELNKPEYHDPSHTCDRHLYSPLGILSPR
jgi:hypothetical protein